MTDAEEVLTEDYERTKQRAVRGSRVMVYRHIAWAVISLVGSTALIRVLGPEDWATYGIAYFLAVFFDQALGANFLGRLVRSPDPVTAEDRQAAVALMHLVGGGTALILIAVSGPAADLYGQADLREALIAVAVCAYVYSFRATSVALLERELDYATIAIAELVDQVSFFALAFALIAAGVGDFDAVAIALAVRGVVPALLLRIRKPVPLVGRLRRQIVSSILRFGTPTIGSFTIILLTGLVPAVILGGGEAEQVAFVMASATIAGYAGAPLAVIQRVSFPALSTLVHAPARFAQALRRTVHMSDTILVSTLVPLCVFGPILIPGVLGDAWEDAAPVLMAMGAGYMLSGSIAIGAAALQALDHPSRAFAVQCSIIATYVAGALALAPEFEGLGVALAYMASRGAGLAMSAGFLHRDGYPIAGRREVFGLLAAVALMFVFGVLVLEEHYLIAAIGLVLAPLWLRSRWTDLLALRAAIARGPAPAPAAPA